MLVHLQRRNGPHMANRLFDSMLQGTCFVVSVNDDKHFFRIHNGSNTYCESGFRYLVDVVVEETRVGDDGICRQVFFTRTACERRTRFVEGDMSIRADSTEEKMYSAVVLNLLFIACALCLQISSITVEDVHILFADVDV